MHVRTLQNVGALDEWKVENFVRRGKFEDVTSGLEDAAILGSGRDVIALDIDKLSELVHQMSTNAAGQQRINYAAA